MSSTKTILLVTTNPPQKMMDVQKVVSSALRDLIFSKHKQVCKKIGEKVSMPYLSLNSSDSDDFRNKWGAWKSFSASSFDFESFSLVFGIGDTAVRSIFTTITNDKYEEIPDNDGIISFSLNDWGMVDEILDVVADACKGFGDVYLRQPNDDVIPVHTSKTEQE